MDTLGASALASLGNITEHAAKTGISGALGNFFGGNAMKKADRMQRRLMVDQYGLMSKGMIKAGLNPFAGLQGSPAQAASMPSVSASSGSGSFTSSPLQSDAQNKNLDSSTEANEALAEKTKAETLNIQSKTPGEVKKLDAENQFLKAQTQSANAKAELTQELARNQPVQRALMKSNIDLNHSIIRNNKFIAGSLEIDLGHKIDSDAAINDISATIEKKTRGVIPAKYTRALARKALEGAEGYADYHMKANVAKRFGENQTHNHFQQAGTVNNSFSR